MGTNVLKPGLNSLKRLSSKSPSPSRSSKQSRRSPSPEEGEVEDTEALPQSSSSQTQQSQQNKRKNVAFPFKRTNKPVARPPAGGAKNVFEENKARSDNSYRGGPHVAAPIPPRKEPAIYERPVSPRSHAPRSPPVSSGRRPHRMPDRDRDRDRDWDGRNRYEDRDWYRERDRGRDRDRALRYPEDDRYDSARRYPPSYDDHHYHHSGYDHPRDDRRENPYAIPPQPWQPADLVAPDSYRVPQAPPPLPPSDYRLRSPTHSTRSLESPPPLPPPGRYNDIRPFAPPPPPADSPPPPPPPLDSRHNQPSALRRSESRTSSAYSSPGRSAPLLLPGPRTPPLPSLPQRPPGLPRRPDLPYESDPRPIEPPRHDHTAPPPPLPGNAWRLQSPPGVPAHHLPTKPRSPAPLPPPPPPSNAPRPPVTLPSKPTPPVNIPPAGPKVEAPRPPIPVPRKVPKKRSKKEEEAAYGRVFVGCGAQDDYEVTTKLGEGTFGEVHKAISKNSKVHVALKRILMHSEKEGMPVTALREIKLLKALKHPSIISLLDMFVVRSNGKDPLSVYMVFPYMDHDLAGMLENERVKLSPSQIKLYMKQLLEGTEYMHRNHIVHRDMKAANLLISNDGQLRIADFGLARVFDESSLRGGKDHRGKDIKYTNCVVTRWYRPPELLLGAVQYGGEIDIWGVGCVLGEMFMRRPILQGKSDIEQLEKIWQLCGTPNQHTWPNYDALPGCEGVKPRHHPPLPRMVNQMYKEISLELADLMDRLLTCNPRQRISAIDALDHDYFWTDPLPADPKSLPQYEASHEYDKRGQRQLQQQHQPPRAPPAPVHNRFVQSVNMNHPPTQPFHHNNNRHPGPHRGGFRGRGGGGGGYNNHHRGPPPPPHQQRFGGPPPGPNNAGLPPRPNGPPHLQQPQRPPMGRGGHHGLPYG